MNTNLKKLTFTSLMIAIVFICTVVIALPLPIAGYINLGDAAVYLSVYILGPCLGMVAGGLGSMLGDAYLGFVPYMIPTLIIKGTIGAVSGYLFRKKQYLFGVLCGMVLMTLGYYCFEVILLESYITPLPNIPFNLMQGFIGSLVSYTLIKTLKKSNIKLLDTNED